MTGCHCDAYGLLFRGRRGVSEIGNEATLSMVIEGRGGMAAGSSSGEEEEAFLALLEASRTGDDGRVKDLLRGGTPPDGRDNAALAIAAGQGWEKVVHWLLRHGLVDHHARDNLSLKLAMRNGHDAVTRRFLKIPDMEPDSDDQWLLRECAAHGLSECVAWLLEHSSVDVRARDHEALRRAAENGHVHVLRQLLAAGMRGGMDSAAIDAIIRQSLDDTSSPQAARLRSALEQQNTDPKKRSDPSARNHEALTLAAKKGHLDCVQALLEGRRTSAEANDFAAVRAAMTANHPDILHCLVVELSSPLGNGVEGELKLAAREGWEEVVRIAVEEGHADPSSGGMCVVQAAVQGGWVGIQRILLQAESVREVAHFDNNWWLLVACQSGWHEIVQALLELGPEDTSVLGGKILEEACKNRRRQVVQLLLEDARVAAVSGRAVKAACRVGDWGIVDALLSSGKVETVSSQSMIEAVKVAALEKHWHTLHRLCAEEVIRGSISDEVADTWPSSAIGVSLKTPGFLLDLYGHSFRGLKRLCGDQSHRTDALLARASAKRLEQRRLTEADVRREQLLEYSTFHPSTALHELAANKLWVTLAVWVEAGGNLHDWKNAEGKSAVDVAADGVLPNVWESLKDGSARKSAVNSLAGQGILDGWHCADGRDLVAFATSRWGANEIACSSVRRGDCSDGTIPIGLLEEAVRREEVELVELLAQLVWEEGGGIPPLSRGMDVACQHGLRQSVEALLRVMKDGGLQPERVGWDHWCRWEWWCTWWEWTDVLEELTSCIPKGTEREFVPWSDSFMASCPVQELSCDRHGNVVRAISAEGWRAIGSQRRFMKSCIPMRAINRSAFDVVVEWDETGNKHGWTVDVGVGQQAQGRVESIHHTLVGSSTALKLSPVATSRGDEVVAQVFWDSLPQHKTTRVGMNMDDVDATAAAGAGSGAAAGGGLGAISAASTHRCIVSCECEMETSKQAQDSAGWAQWFVDGEPVGERMALSSGSIPTVLAQGPRCRVRLCEPRASLLVQRNATNRSPLTMLANQWGASPVHVAAVRNAPLVLDSLIVNGGYSAGTSDSVGPTALHWACLLGRGEATDGLLRHGADMEVPDESNGKTALHCACQCGDAEVTARLVQHGAERTPEDYSGATPSHVAVACGHWECGQEILRRASALEVPGALGHLPSSLASESWRILRSVNAEEDNVIDFPATPHCDVGGMSEEGVLRAIQTSDPLSAVRATIEFVRLHGAQRCLREVTIAGVARSIIDALRDLANAASEESDALLPWLLDTLLENQPYSHPEDRASVHDDSMRSTSTAPQRSHEELLHLGDAAEPPQPGVNAHEQDQFGWTPLHAAMVRGDQRVVAAILRVTPADAATKDGVLASSLNPELWHRVTGHVVVDSPAAASWDPPGSGQEAMIQRLVRMVAEGNLSTELLCHRACLAVEKLGTAVLGKVCKGKVRIGKGSRRWTVLAAAAAAGRCSLCRVCIEHGVEVDKTSHGMTPLHYACQNDCVDCARLLLERGAQKDMSSKDGVTPLWIACHGNHRHVASLLLEQGADPAKADRHGNTAVDAARSLGPSDPQLAEAMEMASWDRAAAIGMLQEMEAEGPQR